MPKLDKAIPNKVVWVELTTPNLEKARTFYGELLGWSFQVDDDPQTGFYTTALREDRRVAALCKQTEQTPGASAWRIFIGSQNVDDTVAKAAAAGGKIVAPPMDVMDYGRMAVLVDPTGADFGVWQAKTHTGVQLVEEPGSLVWNEIYTRDAKKAREFYARVFGFEARPLEEGAMEYWTLHHRDVGKDPIAGLMQMNDAFPENVEPHWNTYFAVTDTDATVKKLEKLGGKVMQPAFDTPFGRMSAVVDPFGAGFCVIRPVE
jgi:predicted enzyme related to lactoylglutathione lyase